MYKHAINPMEIKRSFRESKDKKKQIGILAELNGCDQELILNILRNDIAEMEEQTLTEEEQYSIDHVKRILYSKLDAADKIIRKAELEYKQILIALKTLG